MGSRFVRKVRTASGAVAVQIVEKSGRQVVAVEHVGSAHSDTDLALLLAAAQERLMPGQGTFDLGFVERVPVSLADVADWTEQHVIPIPEKTKIIGRPARSVSAEGKVLASPAAELWDVLVGAYSRLGFDVLDDEGFRAMVLARLIEPTSKAESIRVLDDIAAPHPALRTLFRSLKRSQEHDYRDLLAKAMVGYRTKTTGLAAMIMYDVTTLHFQSKEEDKIRRVGMSKEHRVDPQIQVGLLVDPAGFPLELHMFPGNKAETTTILPVLTAFQERHGITDMVVVADAGMLSAGNLQAIEDAGFKFIVGSRLSKAPYDLQEHFDTKGNKFSNGQILESARVMGTGKNARERRVVYHWSFKRFQRDNQNINHMERRAMDIAEGKIPVRKARFLSVTGSKTSVNKSTLERARQLAGLKGYVTNISQDAMSGNEIIGSYHDLWQVEASFRMTKHDLQARPIWHRQEDAINAHLTVVFASLAIGRHLQELSGMSLKRLITTLKAIKSAKILINGEEVLIPAEIPKGFKPTLQTLKSGY